MNDATFRDFVLDQLQLLGEVDCRRMFGSYGLYHDEVFFSILAQGRLYFKTSAVTRGTYVQRGMQPLHPHPRQTLKSYDEVPVDILEDQGQLAVLARQAVICQTVGSLSRRLPRRLRYHPFERPSALRRADCRQHDYQQVRHTLGW